MTTVLNALQTKMAAQSRRTKIAKAKEIIVRQNKITKAAAGLLGAARAAAPHAIGAAIGGAAGAAPAGVAALRGTPPEERGALASHPVASAVGGAVLGGLSPTAYSKAKGLIDRIRTPAAAAAAPAAAAAAPAAAAV